MDSQNAGNTDRDRAAHRGYPALDHVEIIADEGRKHCGGPEFPVRLRDRPYPVDRRGFVKQHGAPAVHLRIDKAWNEHAAAQSNRIKRSEEHTSELQSLMRNSYAVFCLKKKMEKHTTTTTHRQQQVLVY